MDFHLSLRSLQPKGKVPRRWTFAPPFCYSSPSCSPPDSDDYFDARFGHLIGDNINNEASDSEHHDLPDESRDLKQEGLDSVHQSDWEESVDEALVELVDKVPNWEPYSQLNKFISKLLIVPFQQKIAVIF